MALDTGAAVPRNSPVVVPKLSGRPDPAPKFPSVPPFRIYSRIPRSLLVTRPVIAPGALDPPVAVERLLHDHVSGRARRHFELWNLLMLELWFQRFIDRRP